MDYSIDESLKKYQDNIENKSSGGRGNLRSPGREDAERRYRQAGENRASPLSKYHISPFTGNLGISSIETYSGSSYMKIKKYPYDHPEASPGKRGKIQGFSYSARRRLFQTIAKIKRDAELPNFVTLTFPEKYPTPRDSKKHLDIYFKRCRRKYVNFGAIWKLEPQERGAPHYHLLVWGVETSNLFMDTVEWWHDIAGGGDRNHYLLLLGALKNSRPCVERVRSFKGVWAYAAKYLGKTFEVPGWGCPGRFWGVTGREKIPFGDFQEMEINRPNAVQVMRYGRRFSGMSSRGGRARSMTLYCDADQWIKKIVVGDGE